MTKVLDFRKPRCVLLYARAPEGVRAAEANRRINDVVGDTSLPLVLYHDHFLGAPGGIVLFFVEDAEERDALAQAIGTRHLEDWRVELRPLIYSYSPGSFDDQIAYTLRTYRREDWEQLRGEDRPGYGSPRREAETGAQEEPPSG